MPSSYFNPEWTFASVQSQLLLAGSSPVKTLDQMVTPQMYLSLSLSPTDTSSESQWPGSDAADCWAGYIIQALRWCLTGRAPRIAAVFNQHFQYLILILGLAPNPLKSIGIGSDDKWWNWWIWYSYLKSCNPPQGWVCLFFKFVLHFLHNFVLCHLLLCLLPPHPQLHSPAHL